MVTALKELSKDILVAYVQNWLPYWKCLFPHGGHLGNRCHLVIFTLVPISTNLIKTIESHLVWSSDNIFRFFMTWSHFSQISCFHKHNPRLRRSLPVVNTVVERSFPCISIIGCVISVLGHISLILKTDICNAMPIGAFTLVG